MIFIPIGLNSKIKDPPFLAAGIIIVTAFVSILSFSMVKEYNRDFFNHPERQKYFHALRNLYVNNCDIFQSEDVCRVLSQFSMYDSDRNPLVAHSDLQRYFEKLSPKQTKRMSGIIQDWMSESRLRRAFIKRDRVDAINELRVWTVTNDLVIQKMHRDRDLYSRQNATVFALIKAQLLHGDWLHLMGNLLFFFFFGACLEQAMGRSWLLAIYIMGGSAGLFFNQLLLSDDNTIIMGASANIFACAGAFLRLFWRQSLRIWFNFVFVINKTIELPTWTFFLFFVIIQQLEGMARAQATGVAYLAHAVGFIVGALLAQAWARQKKFESNHESIFPYEKKMLEVISSSQRACKERIDQALDLIYFSPFNVQAYRSLSFILSHCPCESKCDLKPEEQFVAESGTRLIKRLVNKKEWADAGSLYLELRSIGCDALLLLKDLTPGDTIHLGNHLYNNGYINEVKELFTSMLTEVNGEVKLIFEQFLDSLNREQEEKHVG